jgi:hypothetical protein
VWQRVLGVACVLCAVQNETRLCGGAAACLGSGVCVVCCAEWDSELLAACLGSAGIVLCCAEG